MLQSLAVALDAEANTFTAAEGRAGQIAEALHLRRTRIHDRSTLLLKEIGDQAHADLAQVSVRTARCWRSTRLRRRPSPTFQTEPADYL